MERMRKKLLLSKIFMVAGYTFILCLLIVFMMLLESCSKDNNLSDTNEIDDTVSSESLPYTIVETGQTTFYDNLSEISEPLVGESFYGQDAHYLSNDPQYSDNQDGTISDELTGLTWQKSYYTQKYGYEDALNIADTCTLGGYTDWRLPSIKELYSLIMFYGVDPSGYDGSNVDELVPFINTDYFDFRYGLVDQGERIIDAQYVSSTKYVSTTMGGDETVFGVNFADGRIKGYPITVPDGSIKLYEVKLVRGNENYGNNSFIDNDDGTISDLSTGLMWAKNDSDTSMNWQEALTMVQQMNSQNYLGYSDWRLPNVKELQSIVDYTRSPATTGSAAIDPVFNASNIIDEGQEPDYGFYWSSTTHANMQNGGNACYVAFGKALGWMQPPFDGTYTLMDVHGAGAQRSDPKQGDASEFPYGYGPQGDVIRIKNMVRLVRN